MGPTIQTRNNLLHAYISKTDSCYSLLSFHFLLRGCRIWSLLVLLQYDAYSTRGHHMTAISLAFWGWSHNYRFLSILCISLRLKYLLLLVFTRSTPINYPPPNHTHHTQKIKKKNTLSSYVKKVIQDFHLLF